MGQHRVDLLWANVAVIVASGANIKQRRPIGTSLPAQQSSLTMQAYVL